REGQARSVREHLLAGLDFQDRLARFLENHDEPRAASTFALGKHQAAALITYLAPGLRFFHRGQLEGHTQRVSPHLGRAPDEPQNAVLRRFYDQLLSVLRQPVVRDGHWQLVECRPAWEGNWTHDCFLVFAWQETGSNRLIVAVNFADHQSQCHARLPFADLGGRPWRLQDQLSSACYDWNGDDLAARGLYLDMSPWQACVYVLVS
ncbi:MAG: alpha-amylase, partial [Pirellulaceae bacterium]